MSNCVEALTRDAHKYIVKRSRSNRLSEGSNLGILSVKNSACNIERFSPQSKSDLAVAGFSSLTFRICRFFTPKSRVFGGALSRLDFGVHPCHPCHPCHPQQQKKHCCASPSQRCLRSRTIPRHSREDHSHTAGIRDTCEHEACADEYTQAVTKRVYKAD